MTTTVGVSATEREQLRRVVAGVLADRCDEAAVRSASDSELGHDPTLWRTLAADIGALELLLPNGTVDSHGGITDLAAIVEEAGRVLYPGPLLATAAATWTLAHYDPGSPLLGDLATGARTGTVAVTPMTGHEVRVGPGNRLTGVVPFVLDGSTAHLVLIEAASGLWALETADPTVQRSPVETVDRTRRFARLELDAAPARQLTGPHEVATARSVAAVLVATEQVGGSSAALRSAVEYAGLRSQFGRVIGSYQSIKHRCVDVLLAVESARAAVAAAAAAVDADDADAVLLASIAKAAASESYVLAAETNLQIHGGIGFTWEHSAQLHLKRAKVDELLFGDTRWHRDRLGALLGIRKDTP